MIRQANSPLFLDTHATRLVSTLVVLVLASGAAADGAAGTTDEERSELRAFVAAKFEGVQETATLAAGLNVLATTGR